MEFDKIHVNPFCYLTERGKILQKKSKKSDLFLETNNWEWVFARSDSEDLKTAILIWTIYRGSEGRKNSWVLIWNPNCCHRYCNVPIVSNFFFYLYAWFTIQNLESDDRYILNFFHYEKYYKVIYFEWVPKLIYLPF